jgi:hypothetical protein
VKRLYPGVVTMAWGMLLHKDILPGWRRAVIKWHITHPEYSLRFVMSMSDPNVDLTDDGLEVCVRWNPILSSVRLYTMLSI